MNDAEYEVQKARIEALVDKWRASLGLGWWRTEWVYCRDGLKDSEKNVPGSCVVANTWADYRYLDSVIKFDMLEVEKLSDHRLEYIFLHECVHVLVNEMAWQRRDDPSDNNSNAEERVATTIAKAFQWVYEAGRESRSGSEIPEGELT